MLGILQIKSGRNSGDVRVNGGGRETGGAMQAC